MDKELCDKIQSLLIQLDKSNAGKAILQNAKLTMPGKTTDNEFDKHREIINKFNNE
jgi:hypothetical protein